MTQIVHGWTAAWRKGLLPGQAARQETWNMPLKLSATQQKFRGSSLQWV